MVQELLAENDKRRYLTVKNLLIAVVMVLSLLALPVLAQEWTGYISDAKCGLKGASDDHAKCAEKCVKAGAAAVFIADGKVYKIADPAKVQDHVGHKVTITGKMDGDTISVEDVKM